MKRYSDYPTNPNGPFPDEAFTNFKIRVPTQADKEALLELSQYLHDFMAVLCHRGKKRRMTIKSLDNDLIPVNQFMHLYKCPDLIEVVNP